MTTKTIRVPLATHLRSAQRQVSHLRAVMVRPRTKTWLPSQLVERLFFGKNGIRKRKQSDSKPNECVCSRHEHPRLRLVSRRSTRETAYPQHRRTTAMMRRKTEKRARMMTTAPTVGQARRLSNGAWVLEAPGESRAKPPARRRERRQRARQPSQLAR